MWQGGNQWSSYDSFLSFFRHVAQLPLDYAAWDAWETLSLHSGPRIVHKDFCLISDRPAVLLVDAQGRPHCDTGPFCRWRDGSAIYSVHGVRVPARIIEQPKTITVREIEAETNAEVRRIMIDRYGLPRYITDSGTKEIQRDDYGRLYRKEIADDEPLVVVRVVNSTPEPDGSRKEYWLRVPPNVATARQAVAWTFSVDQAEYAPQVET